MPPKPTTLASVVAVGLVVAALGATLGPSVGAQEGSVVGRPSLTVVAAGGRVAEAGPVTLDLRVSNGGDLTRGGPERFEERVTTARNVRVEVLEERLSGALADALTVESGPVLVGTVEPGVAGPFAVDLTLARLPPGRYELPVALTYEYTSLVEYSDVDAPRYRDTERTVVETVPLVVESRPRLAVEPVAGQRVAPNTRSAYALRVTNVGTAAARAVSLDLRTTGATLYFGGRENRGEAASLFVGRLQPGASRVVNVSTGVYRDAVAGRYAVTASLDYETTAGVPATAGPTQFGVVVGTASRSSLASPERFAALGTAPGRGADGNVGLAASKPDGAAAYGRRTAAVGRPAERLGRRTCARVDRSGG